MIDRSIDPPFDVLIARARKYVLSLCSDGYRLQDYKIEENKRAWLLCHDGNGNSAEVIVCAHGISRGKYRYWPRYAGAVAINGVIKSFIPM